MTDDEITAEVARWSYKPGYELHLAGSTPERVTLGCRFTYASANNPAELVDVSRWIELARPWSVEMLKAYIQILVDAVETHEVEEWLRRDGERVHDPHH